MRIITLRAENVKRLRAVEITPDGNTVVIAGRNAQGKSSVLDAIWMALAGGNGAKDTSRPIRDGEKKAKVELDLGDLVVTRRWTDKTTTLEVTAKDGSRYSSPQTVLDGLIGRLSFDPLAFAQQDPKGQLATLLSVVELPFDPAELAQKRQTVFDHRTDANREVRRLEALVSSLPAVPAQTPDEEQTATAIGAELEAALENARAREIVKQAYERELERVADAREEIKRLEKLLGDANDALADATKASEAALAEGNALPARVDPEPIRAKLAEVDKTNELVRAKRQGTQLRAQLKEFEELADSLTRQLDQIDQSKTDAIAAARMPLEGLSFDEDGVLYNGVPFSQCSAAERLRAGIAVAMALNPTIRVIRITDGSLLDAENLALIDEMAAEHDFQIWLERVDETGSVGITIEDGEVVTIAEVAA